MYKPHYCTHILESISIGNTHISRFRVTEKQAFVLRPICENLKKNKCNKLCVILVCIYLSTTQTHVPSEDKEAL